VAQLSRLFASRHRFRCWPKAEIRAPIEYARDNYGLSHRWHMKLAHLDAPRRACKPFDREIEKDANLG
jgi:hypothetical protein